MTPLKPSQLRTLLSATIAVQEPVLISGSPGVGKTDIVSQAAAESGTELLVTHPVVSDPTDFKGLPFVVDGKATFLPFGDLQRIVSADKPLCVFLDDLGQAPPSVQAAAMQMLLARAINGQEVSKKVTFVAATNRRTDRAGVSGILEPVKSRFLTSVELAADLNDWCTWANTHAIAPEVIAFLRFRPGLLCDFKPAADMTNSPCPRTWSAVSRIMKLNLPRELQVPVISGAVGEGASTEYVAFLRVWADMVSPDLIFASPDTAGIPTEPSALYAVATALGVRVTAATMVRYAQYLDRLVKGGFGEFAAVSLQTALSRDPKLANTPGYIKAMSGNLGQLMLGE